MGWGGVTLDSLEVAWGAICKEATVEDVEVLRMLASHKAPPPVYVHI
jgi:hypothetical protein